MGSTTTKKVKIGKVAKSTGLPVSTVRYYLKRGLIDEEYRTPGGVRLFDREKTVQKIKKVQDIKDNNTLEQIKTLL